MHDTGAAAVHKLNVVLVDGERDTPAVELHVSLRCTLAGATPAAAAADVRSSSATTRAGTRRTVVQLGGADGPRFRCKEFIGCDAGGRRGVGGDAGGSAAGAGTTTRRRASWRSSSATRRWRRAKPCFPAFVSGGGLLQERDVVGRHRLVRAGEGGGRRVNGGRTWTAERDNGWLEIESAERMKSCF